YFQGTLIFFARRTKFIFKAHKIFKARFWGQNRAFSKIAFSKRHQLGFLCPEKQKWILNLKKDYFKTKFS
ncbi:MAG: hypothetical protein NC252_09270, partial [Roseburia sp.]|nr:hypothetical protein [Roseburia sp.]